MTGNGERPRVTPVALLPTLAVLGLLLLVWAATTGPVGVMSGSGRIAQFGHEVPTATASDSQGTGNLRETTSHVQQQLDLAWLGTLIVSALFVALGIALFLVLRWAWRNRWRPPPKAPVVDFDVLPDSVIVEAISQDRDDQLAAVEQDSPRNGIVACWVRLEQSVAEAGVRRHPAETSAELATRVLRSLDLDPRAVGSLARLYREARFSEHELGEDARQAARSALVAIHDELRSKGAVS